MRTTRQHHAVQAAPIQNVLLDAAYVSHTGWLLANTPQSTHTLYRSSISNIRSTRFTAVQKHARSTTDDNNMLTSLRRVCQ
jgi:hypothetical protein